MCPVSWVHIKEAAFFVISQCKVLFGNREKRRQSQRPLIGVRTPVRLCARRKGQPPTYNWSAKSSETV